MNDIALFNWKRIAGVAAKYCTEKSSRADIPMRFSRTRVPIDSRLLPTESPFPRNPTQKTRQTLRTSQEKVRWPSRQPQQMIRHNSRHVLEGRGCHYGLESSSIRVAKAPSVYGWGKTNNFSLRKRKHNTSSLLERSIIILMGNWVTSSKYLHHNSWGLKSLQVSTQ